jgi:hypothetical protein
MVESRIWLPWHLIFIIVFLCGPVDFIVVQVQWSVIVNVILHYVEKKERAHASLYVLCNIIRSVGVWRWYINITITILDIIHRPVFI